MAGATAADESRILREYWDLLRSPLYWGVGVPRGDRRLVVVLPGLFGNDIYLSPLRIWLARIGYRPAMSTIAFNAGCSNRLTGKVEDSLQLRLRRHTGEVAVIGHSRGGMLGKALVNRLGSRCTRFIVLGSPLGAVVRAGGAGLVALAGAANESKSAAISSPVAEAGRRALSILDPECDSPFCNCPYIADLLAPFPSQTQVTSIYTSEDPIVAPSASLIDGANNVEVTGTHSGLALNRQVYRHIAAALH